MYGIYQGAYPSGPLAVELVNAVEQVKPPLDEGNLEDPISDVLQPVVPPVVQPPVQDMDIDRPQDDPGPNIPEDQAVVNLSGDTEGALSPVSLE